MQKALSQIGHCNQNRRPIQARTAAWPCRAHADSSPPKVAYRSGQPEDAGQIASIILAQKMNPLGLRPERFVIADMDGAVQGFCQLAPHGETLELRSLYVKPEARELGIGRELVARNLEAAGAKEVYLVCPEYRKDFYEKCGFEEKSPSELPRYLLVDIVLGGVVLAIVERTRIVGMVYRRGS